MKTFIISVILLSFTQLKIKAELETMTPTFGDSLAPISPIIQLYSDKRIHMNDLFRTSPIDSNNFYSKPQIYLIKTLDYDSIPVNLHPAFAEKLIIDTLNYRTLSLFTLGNLMNDISYTIVVDSLPLKDLEDSHTTYLDTVYYDYFRVLPDLPKVIGFSPIISNDYINCEDTITFKLSGPIDTSLVPIDSLFKFSSLDGISYDTLGVDSIVIAREFTSESFDYEIDNFKREVNFYRTSKMETGKSFFVSYDATKLGLDSSYIFYGTFRTLESSYIRAYSKHQDTTITIPDSLQPSIGTNYFNLTSSDTIEIAVKDNNKYLEFSHWESNISHINNSTDKRIMVHNSCENFSISDIVAVFVNPCIDTVQIAWDIQDSVDEVRLLGFLDSLGNNKYTVSKKDSNSLKLFIKPKPGYVYDYCNIHDSIVVNTLMENVVEFDFSFFQVPCDTHFIVNINTKPLVACTEFNVCVSISDFNDQIGLSIDQIINIDGITSWDNPFKDNHKTGCLTFSIPPDQRTFSLDAEIISQYSDCYEISGIWSSDDFAVEYSEDEEGVSSFDRDFLLDKDKSCNLKINILVRPKIYTLEVHHVLKDDKTLPDEVKLNIHNVHNDENGEWFDFELIYDDVTGELIDFVEYYRYPCNTVAEFFPKIYNSKLFLHSKWKCPSDFSPVDNSVVCASVSSSPYYDYLTFTMDDNYKIYYEYKRAPFYATTLTVYKNNDVDIQTYKFRGIDVDEDEIPLIDIQSGMPVDIYSINNQDTYPVAQNLPRPSTDNGAYELNRNYHRKTSKVIVKFSHSVNINSLVSNKAEGYGGMYSIDNDGYEIKRDVFLRRDGVLARTYDGEINAQRGGSIRLIANDEVEFTFATQSSDFWYPEKFFYAPHMSQLRFFLGQDISRYSDGEKLANYTGENDEITIKTRNPGLYVAYDSYSRYEKYDIFRNLLGDNCAFSNKPDVFYHFYSSVAENVLSSDDLVEIEALKEAGKSSSVIDNVAHNTVKIMNQVLLQASIINRNGYPVLGVLLMDEGTSLSAYNHTAVTGGKLTDELIKAVTTDDKEKVLKNSTEKLKPVGKQNPFLPGNAIASGLQLFFELAGCADLPIGGINYVGNPMNNWSPVDGKIHFLYSGGTLFSDDPRLSDPVYNDWFYRSILMRGVSEWGLEYIGY